MQLVYKHKNKILLVIMILMLLPFVFNIGLESDEPFSMGIIKHGYGAISSLTAMDIHPPLYYWVLKFFLSITTFWTSSIFVKIIFARVLSLIFSLVTLYYLINILHFFKLNYSNYIISFIFFISPAVYGAEGIASSIRMYSLGTMLCTICFYYLMLFGKNSKVKYLTIICLSAMLTLYTQYLIGMIAGLYILLVLTILVINKKYKPFLQLLVTSIISILLYIPWIPEIIKQFSVRSVGAHVDVLLNDNIKYIITRYVLIIVLALIIIFHKKVRLYNNLKLILFVNVILTILLLLINIKLNPYSISVRYTSIALIMNYVIVGTILVNNFNKQWIFKIMTAMLLFVLLIMNIHNVNYQKNTELVPSISFYKDFNNIKEEKIKTVNSKKYELSKYIWYPQGGNSIYFSSINRKVNYVEPLNVYDSIGNGNGKLFKSIYPTVDNYVFQPK